MNGLSIIIATSGRPTLANTLASLQPQLKPGDEVLVDVNDAGDWGHSARNRMMARARVGNGVCFMDDDDIYLPGALYAMREAFRAEPHRVHIFRMIYRSLGDGRYDVLWRRPVVELGNVSTQQFLLPSPTDARFGDRYEGDFDCLSAAVAQRPDPRFHERIVAHYRPAAGAEMVITNPENGKTITVEQISPPRCTCPIGWGATVATNCERHNPRPRHTVTGA